MLVSCLAASSLLAAAQVDFNRDVRPLLSDNCFACHGPDTQKIKGGLRLDQRDAALKPAKSGKLALVPGKPDESELVKRIFTGDADDLMPPAESNKSLTPAQKDLLKRWIADGAEYQGHWAYTPPVKAAVADPARGIDELVQRRLREKGLKPSPTADRRTLIRRLYFDLVGLPPKPEEVEVFERDKSPDAYEKLVERLLASEHFGERMAIGWLDVVRFADTIGYHSDNPRNIWPYRDYVIRAFNANKPFDQFTREQLAGDLLPNPTQEQKVASGFNRLLLTTEEGGAQPKDYEARYLTDRVRAVGSVWLGQTIGCAQCHDHKFDPITQRDFYALGAFFTDVKEAIIGGREPGMFVTTPAQAEGLRWHAERVEAKQRAFDALLPGLADSYAKWLAEQEQSKSPPKEIAEVLKVAADKRDQGQKDRLFNHYKSVAPELATVRAELAEAKKSRADFEATVPRTLVTERSDTPRTVRFLPRGNWMIETGDVMEPALPAFLAKNQPADRRLTRLDLANWLVAPENPLTARVVMNRLWRQFFGVGLSKVMDDFGAQGETPPNQPLLDWLACEFRDSGWDVKHMVRLMVLSDTYRQTSQASREELARDPDNRDLARQGRWRLDAELVRDNALSIAGLLELSVGGPSVKPYQPDGYWENLNFPVRSYDESWGADQFRRGLYTWWQRSFVHPSMLAFDAPTREECAAERSRSNIPQQALVLLNDPTYVEAARSFALRTVREAKGNAEARITWMWRQALGRKPDAGEVATLRALLDKHLGEYRANPASAEEYLKVGSTKLPAGLNAAELAAWANVARTILNLHETITRG